MKNENMYQKWHKEIYISRSQLEDLLGVKNRNRITEIMNMAEEMRIKDGLLKPRNNKVYLKYIKKMIGEN